MFRKVILSLFFVFCLSGFAFAQATADSMQKEQRVPVPGALQILKKPQASYTDEARQNNVQGTIVLQVVFLANGKIGDVTFVEEKSNGKKMKRYGLVAQAVKAAKKIKFNPATKDGVPINVTKNLSYTFTIY
jgi:TonB family protein